MKTIKLSYIEDQGGNVGWMPSKFKSYRFDTYVPFSAESFNLSLITHDLFDHADKPQYGTIEEELHALGAYLYRTEFSTFGDHQPSDFTSALAMTFEEALKNEGSALLYKCSKKHNLNSKDKKAIQNILEKAIKQVNTNYAVDDPLRVSLLSFLDEDIETFKNALDWLAAGYIHARNRFKQFSRYDRYQVFSALKHLTGEIIKVLKNFEAFVGTEVSLSYNFRYYEVFVKEKTGYEV